MVIHLLLQSSVELFALLPSERLEPPVSLVRLAFVDPSRRPPLRCPGRPSSEMAAFNNALILVGTAQASAPFSTPDTFYRIRARLVQIMPIHGPPSLYTTLGKWPQPLSPAFRPLRTTGGAWYIQSMGLRQEFGHSRSSWDPCTMSETPLPKSPKTTVPEGSAPYPDVPQGWR